MLPDTDEEIQEIAALIIDDAPEEWERLVCEFEYSPERNRTTLDSYTADGTATNLLPPSGTYPHFKKLHDLTSKKGAWKKATLTVTPEDYEIEFDHDWEYSWDTEEDD